MTISETPPAHSPVFGRLSGQGSRWKRTSEFARGEGSTGCMAQAIRSSEHIDRFIVVPSGVMGRTGAPMLLSVQPVVDF